MTIREQYEELEAQKLSPFATLSKKSLGRLKPEEQCDIRTSFQRDRDRIIYSKSFRRLKHKTQVFISPEGDHYRTRLTHTLEVTQIARTIALGHDLGHTPFGHTGESVLNKVCSHGFKHNDQSLRVVDVLEKDGGLNLTFEVRDGIKNHTGNEAPSTLEGQIIRFADRIAYINHDIEDAIRGNILDEALLPRECTNVLGYTSSSRINSMIVNIIENSTGKNIISMSPEFQQAKDGLRDFMFKNVYDDFEAKKDKKRAKMLVETLYLHIKDNPDLLPDEYKNMLSSYDIDRIVCDYVAGMTDPYAIKKFSILFIPGA